MAQPVRIEQTAFSDPRIELLGELAGYNRFEAIGRLAHLWSFCTERQLYVVPESIIRASIGPAGAQHMLDAGLAEAVEGGYRIRGLAGRIEWLGGLKEKRARAGRARVERVNRDTAGRMLADNRPAHAQHMLDESPAPDQHISAKPSANTNTNTTTTTPALSPEQTARHPGNENRLDREARERGELAKRTWAAMSALRNRVAAELRISALPLAQVSGAEPVGFRDLRARIREEGESAAAACEHVLRVRESEARKARSIEWLDDKAFSERAWRFARGMPVPASTGERKQAARISRHPGRTPHSKTLWQGEISLGAVFVMPDGTDREINPGDDVWALELEHYGLGRPGSQEAS